METARLQLQGFYSLLAGLVLLVGVPLYQAIVLGPAGYLTPSDTAFNHADFGPLLNWISNHSGAFLFFRLLELLTFLFALRLPLALYRALRGYGRTLARWMLVGGLAGLALFAILLALSTISFVNAAASYSRLAPSSAAARDTASSFSSLYGVEGLAQNTLGGVLLALFLLCASLLIARSGKLQSLLVYFGLLAAALMGALALFFAISPPDAQAQLTTPALAAFAAWLIWLGILLMRRAQRLVTSPPPTLITSPATEQGGSSPAAGEAQAPQAESPEQAPVLSQPAATPSDESQTPDPSAESAPPQEG
jgi:hypothetical protein